MPFTLGISATKKYINVVATGSLISEEELLDYSQKVVAAAGDHGKRCFLLDERALHAEFDIVSIVGFAQLLQKLGIQSLMLRVAVLEGDSRPQGISQDFELILRNRGFLYQVFKDITEAVAWLENFDCSMVDEKIS